MPPKAEPGKRIEPRLSRPPPAVRQGQPQGDQPAVLPRSPNELLEPQRAPAPPRRKVRKVPRTASRTVRILNGLLTFLLVAMAVTAGAFFLLRYQFDKPGPLQYSTVIVIPKGDGMNAIADRLEKEGIVADSRVFAAAVLWFRANGKLKFGEYEIKKNASMREVLDTLVEGKATLSKVTIPEGLTSFQIVELLKKQEQLTGDVIDIPAEGSLLPETYKFAPGSERKDLIERMKTEFTQRVEKLWQTKAANLPFTTLNEAITMASLVEKETGRPDERARVAGVFLNRLKKKMRLQSDPTIIYHLTNGHGALGRPILKSEIEDKNPYNTYKIDGLPPGPICNPGSAAIEAVLTGLSKPDRYVYSSTSWSHRRRGS